MRLGIHYTDADNTVEFISTKSIVKVHATTATPAELKIKLQDDKNSYLGDQYNKYHLQKISIYPVGTATGNVTVLVSFDGLEYKTYKTATVSNFIDNLLDWYGYISEHEIKVLLTSSDGEFYVHITWSEK